jgi:hypothetical protein
VIRLRLSFLQRQNRDDLVSGRVGKSRFSPLFRVTSSERTAHLYVIGVSGKGKSRLLEHCLYQDITFGRGCGLIDPHSLRADDLFGSLLSRGILGDPEIRKHIIYVYPPRQAVPSRLTFWPALLFTIVSA